MVHVLQIEQKIASRRKISYIHYLLRILLTQPCDTCSCRLISQGRMPCKANCRIWTLKWSGKGRPFVNSLPYWFIFLPPTSSWKKKEFNYWYKFIKTHHHFKSHEISEKIVCACMQPAAKCLIKFDKEFFSI